MERLHDKKLTAVMCGLLTIGACSDGSNETGGEVDTRPTMEQFEATKSESQSLSFSAQDTDNSIQAANRASISFAQYKMEFSFDENRVITSWPMFSTLALVAAASHGDTADEIALALNEFGLEQSWPLAYQALYQSQADLLASGVTRIEHDLWSQHDSQFEPEFLTQIDTVMQPHYHSADFAAGEEIAAAVDEVATSTSGEHYAFGLEQYADTRLVALNQIKTVGAFDAEGLQVVAFDGLFENSDSELIRTPMIRIQGTMDYYENSALIAYRIPVASNKLSLISIQPKDHANNDTLRNLETVLADLNSGWVAQESTAVLPELSASFGFPGDWLADWQNTNLLYSEEQADLRTMDRDGGLYMQGTPWSNRLSISEQGIELAGISGHAATFSERNIFGPHFGDDTHGIGLVVVGIGFPFCTEIPPEPDLSKGLIIIQDTQSGLIYSVLSLNTVTGTLEGRTDCIPIISESVEVEPQSIDQ